MILFHFCSPTDPLKAPNVGESFPMMGLHMSHLEGKPAELFIHFPLKVSLPSHSFGRLWYVSKNLDQPQEICLFQGLRVSLTACKQESFLSLKFSASPKLLEKNAEKLLQGLKNHSAVKYEKMADFYEEPGDQNLLQQLNYLLSLSPWVLYWDRVLPQCGFSSLYRGKKIWDLSKDYDILRMSITQDIPLEKITIRSWIQWTEVHMGLVPIADAISEKFPHGKLSFYGTKKQAEAFMDRWPRPGDSVNGQSGYRVFRSHIQMSPEEDRELPWDSLPRLLKIPFPEEASSSRLTWDPMESGASKAERFLKRYDFQVELDLLSRRLQKRMEEVRFSIKSQIPSWVKGQRLVKEFKLCSPKTDLALHQPFSLYSKGDLVIYNGEVFKAKMDNQGVFSMEYWEKIPAEDEEILALKETFFLTPRGKKTLEFLTQAAQNILAREMRCVKISLVGTLRQWHSITLDDEILLKNVYLWNGKIFYLSSAHNVESLKVQGKEAQAEAAAQGLRGKVIAYEIFADGQGRQEVRLTFASFFGPHEKSKPSEEISEKISQDKTSSSPWIRKRLQQKRAVEKIGMLHFKAFRNQRPKKIFSHEEGPGSINVRIHNDPLEQKRKIFDALRDGDLESLKKKDPLTTRIQIECLPMKGAASFEHILDLQPLDPYDPQKDPTLGTPPFKP